MTRTIRLALVALIAALAMTRHYELTPLHAHGPIGQLEALSASIDGGMHTLGTSHNSAPDTLSPSTDGFLSPLLTDLLTWQTAILILAITAALVAARPGGRGHAIGHPLERAE